MKKIVIYIVYLGLFVGSFYLTNHLALTARNKDPIMQEILLEKNNEVEAVNAIIEDSYITPGISGKKVNITKSFNKMKQLGTYNENYLVYDLVTPVVSIDNNLDKIIKKGNISKNEVSIITENANVLSYLVKNNLKGNTLIPYENLEVVNNNNYYDKKIAICLNEEDIKSKCLKAKKRIVEANLVVNKSNLIEVKNKLTNGDILYIDNNISVSEFIYICNLINQKGLVINYLSELIRE